LIWSARAEQDWGNGMKFGARALQIRRIELGRRRTALTMGFEPDLDAGWAADGSCSVPLATETCARRTKVGRKTMVQGSR
jgi:hypothetical protein